MIALSPGWLALHYRMETVREEIPHDVLNEASPDEITDLFEGPRNRESGESEHKEPILPAPSGTATLLDDSPVSTNPATPSPGFPGKMTADEELRMLADLVAPVAEDVSKGRAVPSPSVPVPVTLGSSPIPSMTAGSPASAGEQSRESPAEPTLFPQSTETSPVRRSLFASLPTLRRHREGEGMPAPVIRVSDGDSRDVAQETIAAVEPTPLSVAPVGGGVVRTDNPFSGEVFEAAQAALQAVFMTEERLTPGSAVTRAADLPGLKACLLARGDAVLCTSDSPEGRELRTLSGQAMTMLSQIRSSSASMGLGSVPSVTLHAEAGVLSILQERDLCLIVLHSGRGFLPGVRERLREILHHLPPVLALTDASPGAGCDV